LADRLLYSEIERIDAAVAESGLTLVSADGHRPRELLVEVTNQRTLRLIAYVWALRPGGGGRGVRPEDERRVQLTRPGDAEFRSEQDAQTLLLGYDPKEDVYAAWSFDQRRHTRAPSGAPVRSPSAHTKQWALEAAIRDGLCAFAHQVSARDPAGLKTSVEEVVINFRPDQLGAYLDWLNPPSVLGRQKALRARRRRRETTERVVRDARFRKQVTEAYAHRCCLCGFGGGVVEAAHIRPVEDGGPDVVPNGLALCPTHHRLFDKGYVRLRVGAIPLIEINEKKMLRERVGAADRQRIIDGLPWSVTALPTIAAAAPAGRFIRRHRTLYA
jgi:hypothetical protein